MQDEDAELGTLLAETWEDGVAVLADVLDLDGGKAALAAAQGRLERVGSTGEQGGALNGVRLERGHRAAAGRGGRCR